MPSRAARLKPSAIESALGFVDLAIGLAILAYCVVRVLVALRPSAPTRDNGIFGLIGLALLFPFGIAAFAAFDAMRSRADGRWVLQIVVLLPMLVLGVAVVWAKVFTPAG